MFISFLLKMVYDSAKLVRPCDDLWLGYKIWINVESGNDLLWRLAITWANVDQVSQRHMVPLGHNELRQSWVAEFGSPSRNNHCSYTLTSLTREYRVEIDIHGCYSLVMMAFAPICMCRNNQWIWCHNVSTSHLCDVTDWTVVMSQYQAKKTVLGENGKMRNQWLFRGFVSSFRPENSM